ncbi:hypothetical protein B0H14DRAFT_3903684 [Mycena olivaceomarginata]|nr:hypothetical protein B0H14DRAFT_3903684 [Mycena olivaceomarginata]
MLVPARQVILARYVGVTHCPHLDEYIEKRGTLPAEPQDSSFDVDEHGPAEAQLPHIFIFFAGSINSTLSIVSNAACIAIYSHRYPAMISCPPPPASTVDPSPSSVANHDTLWATGRVLRTPDVGPWPEGVYAQDMVAAIGMIKPKTAVPIAERFEAVFGREFPRSAWYQNLRAWKACEQDERDAAAGLPRSAAGLWTVWRSTTTGWAKVCTTKTH